MRDTFVKTLCELARYDKRVILVTGDLGFGVLVPFWNEFPDQFINAGVAEQNMTGIATGLALEGKIVFTYSIANFSTLRCLEQIRNDAAYHHANVKIVSIGGGLCYGSLGMSHHATEDIAIMRALPNVIVLAPGDFAETESAVKAIYEKEGTCYLRLGRGGEKNVHEGHLNFRLGEAIKIIDGAKISVFSTGGILSETFEAVKKINNLGFSVGFYSFPTVKPIDKETIKKCAKKTDLIITVEEHNIVGGFGSAVAEVIAGIGGKRARLVTYGIEDKYSSRAGSQDYLRHEYGVSIEKLVQKIVSLI